MEGMEAIPSDSDRPSGLGKQWCTSLPAAINIVVGCSCSTELVVPPHSLLDAITCGHHTSLTISLISQPIQ